MLNLQNKFNRNLFTESIIDEDKNKSGSNGGKNNLYNGENMINTGKINSRIETKINEENYNSNGGGVLNLNKDNFENKIIAKSQTNQININFTQTNFNSSPQINKKLKQFEKIISKKSVNLNELKALAWKGVPFGKIKLFKVKFIKYLEPVTVRAEVWKFLLGYYPSNTDLKENMIKRKRQEFLETCLVYESLLENPTKNMNDSEMKIYKQISVDVPRTMPEHKLFSYDIIRKMMLRVLYVWSMRHPASGYVQGFNDLCTPFFVIFITQHMNGLDIEFTLDINEDSIFDLGPEILFEIEADTYWCFTKMMDRIQTNYTHNQPGLTLMINKMEEIIKLVDMDLYKHLFQFDITFMQFSFRWMNCYLMREFSLKLIIRIWDTYFSEEDAFNSFHLYVCAGLLLNFSEKIKKMTEFQETMMFLQNLPMNNWSLEEIDVLLAKAYQIHIMYGKLVEKNTSSIINLNTNFANLNKNK